MGQNLEREDKVQDNDRISCDPRHHNWKTSLPLVQCATSSSPHPTPTNSSQDLLCRGPCCLVRPSQSGMAGVGVGGGG